MYYQWRPPLPGSVLALCQTLARGLDLRPGPGGSTASARAETQALFYPVLGTWLHGAWTNAMVMALWPSSQLVAHTDPPIVGQRYHVPLIVNEGCWVFHLGTWQQLMPGQVYRMDPTEVHGAVNWGTEIRMHLVVDVEG